MNAQTQNYHFMPQKWGSRTAADQISRVDQQSSGASHDQCDDNDNVTSKRLQQLGMELPPHTPEVM